MSAKTIIITAGGIGKRMGGDLPKQFLRIHNKVILFHTITRFHDYDNQAQILLTLPEEWLTYWNDLCISENFIIPHQVIIGGKERYHSIQKALAAATGDFIAVHDGVRPFVSNDTIARCFKCAELNGTAIPVLEIKESIRLVTESLSQSVNRAVYRTVQTPQVFQKSLLIESYKRPFHSGITDDASLVEENGINISLVEGNEENIKLTTPFDLKIGELIAMNF
jgi:2-C-methyl-D-erythritol 4-phosphate cytidylyltransferase